MQQPEYKQLLKEKCISLIEKRMDTLRVAMELAQLSASEETKSSAGDKYETSRAMGHLEKDMYARQLVETSKELASLMSIDCNLVYKTISPGTLVRCENHLYFILAGIGKIYFNGELIFIISPVAPVAKSLMGKKTGDTVLMKNGIHHIKEII